MGARCLVIIKRDVPDQPVAQARQSVSRRRRFHLITVLLGSAIVVGGCSPPSVGERDKRRLLDALLTAITMKNADWLEDDAALAEAWLQVGHLTDEEYRELQSIIETARSGNWAGAEKEAYDFRRRHPFVPDGQ